MGKDRNNYISTAKGIGIVLMVIGHSGAPDIIVKFIYQFHMPLFFFCSGYFMKSIEDKKKMLSLYTRRFKSIYIKFFLWSMLFLALHNVFFYMNIYNDIITFRGQASYIYNISDFLYKACKITFSMNEHEQLLRSFWFLKQLFIASIIVPTMLYVANKIHYAHNCILLLISLFALTLISKSNNWSLPAIWDLSLLCMSSTFYLSGYVLKKYNILNVVYNTTSSIFLLLVLFIGLYYLPWTNMLEYTTRTVIPFFVVAISGTILTVNISRQLESYKVKHVLYYLGQNTMVILAMHMLCFKLGNLLKIAVYNMSMYKLAEFQVINEHNHYFWIIYTIIGITIPLIIDYIMKRTRITRTFWGFLT